MRKLLWGLLWLLALLAAAFALVCRYQSAQEAANRTPASRYDYNMKWGPGR